MNAVGQISGNARSYNRLYLDYERLHGDIFNPTEQSRLRKAIALAASHILTPSIRKTALDYGCGSGNLTKHLLDLGFCVTSADISDKFISLVEQRYAKIGTSTTLKLNGTDLACIDDHTFDFVGSYSVLHHIPDYLHIVRELARVVRPGGVIFLDHEANGTQWKANPEYESFLQLAYPKAPKSQGHYLKPATYIRSVRRIPERLRLWLNPRYMPEGDIHLWPDDHIEWDRIQGVLLSADCEIVTQEDYLLFMAWYPTAVYDDFKSRCTDTRLMIARKRS